MASEDNCTVKFAVGRWLGPYYEDEKWGMPGYELAEECRSLWIAIYLIESQDEKFERLMDLLLHDKRRWESIHLSGNGRQSSSAAFLSILQATFSKTDSLCLSNCMADNASFACLNSGLVMEEGIRDVEIVINGRHRPITRAQMSLLSQGLSLTTTLETLVLPTDLATPGVVQYLIAGLAANQSLKYLESRWCDYPADSLPSVVSALHSHPKLRHLLLSTYKLLVPRVQESLQTLLSRDDCKLEEVSLGGPLPYNSWENASSSFGLDKFENPNIPLKSLCVHSLGIESSSLRTMLQSCRCLAELSLMSNKVANLEPLVVLLLGDSCSLEILKLDDNPICLNSARIFAEKLPRMKVPRRLDWI